MAYERITNGGFETGDLSGWTVDGGNGHGVGHDVWGQATIEGYYNFYCYHTTTLNISQTVNLIDTNSLSFKAKHVDGTHPIYMRIYIDGNFVEQVELLNYGVGIWQTINIDISAYSNPESNLKLSFVGTTDGMALLDIVSITSPTSPTVTLSGTILDEWSNPIRDADITISNGTKYMTTTDGNGTYSQTVYPDTYNITVSKSHSTFHNMTETKSVTTDTTLNITMPTNKIPGKHNTSGMSIPGGISLGFK